MSISYIIPVYNIEFSKFKRCVISIEKFSKKNHIYDYEIIIINDGSKDELTRKYKKYVEKKSQIKYYYHENSGVSFSRNKGIKKSTKEYITFIDSDDYLSEKYMNSDKLILNADLIIFNIYIITQNKIRKYNFHQGSVEWMDALKDHIINASFSSPVAKFYKRKFLLNNNLLFNTKYVEGEDNYFNTEVLSCKPTIYYYNYPIYIYEFYVTSTYERINKKFDNVLEYLSDIHNKRKEIIKKYHFNDNQKMEQKVNNRLILNSFGIYLSLIETKDKEKIEKLKELIRKNRIKIKKLEKKAKLFYILLMYNNSFTAYLLKKIKKVKKFITKERN